MSGSSSSSTSTATASQASSAPKTRSGSCLCHRVKYTVLGEPQAFRVCHCTSCKKFTGSAFQANVFFTAKQIAVSQGADLLKTFRDEGTQSGHALERIFCTNCGSSVFMRSLHPISVKKDMRIVCEGTFDEDPGLTPNAEVFAGNRRSYLSVTSKPQPKLNVKL